MFLKIFVAHQKSITAFNKFLNDLLKNINQLPDQLDIEFGKNNLLFSGRFYQYNQPNSQVKIEVENATFFVTKLRRDALFKMVKELKLGCEESLQIYVFDGPQGIGKTFSLTFSNLKDWFIVRKERY